jgi:hypothetical protein
MSRKNNLRKFDSIVAGSMSGTNTLTSSVTDVQWLDDIGYQFVWTGSPTGNISIEVSADYAPGGPVGSGPANAGNWTPLTLSYWNGASFTTSNSIPTSVGSPVYIDLTLLSAPWIRAKYTNVSGSGTLTATITAKEVG